MAKQDLHPDKALIEAQGLHHVLSRLARLGWIAAETPRRTAGVDILAALPASTGPQLKIQVKTTRRGAKHGWPMGESDEHPTADFYAVVDVEPLVPEVYVVPADTVGRFLQIDHSKWKATPRRDGQPHGKSEVRKLRDKPLPGFPAGWLEHYRERWDLLSSLAAPPNSTPKTP